MGVLDNIKNGEFTGLKRALGGSKKGSYPVASDNGGIGNTPSAPSGGTKLFNAGDDSGNSPVNLGLRGLQTFLSFVNLFIYIGISLFQARWKVGPSGLTVLGIMMNVEALLVGALFLAVPLLYENAKFLRGIQRGLRVVRTAFIIHAFQAGFMVIMALATTISAYTGGCKDAARDPHAEIEGYVDALRPFCRNKRAGAAFFWLTFLAWAAALGLVVVTWQRTRNAPASGGFSVPGAGFPEDHADAEAFAHSSEVEGDYSQVDQADYRPRPSGDFYGAFAGGAPEFNQSTADLHAREQGYLHPQTHDPFADTGDGSDYRPSGKVSDGEGVGDDAYAVIRKASHLSALHLGPQLLTA